MKNNKELESMDLSSDVVGMETESYSVLLGRADYCRLRLQDKLISREHAKIEFFAGKWFVEKISPLGELKRNGDEISQKIEIKNGDVLSCGPFVMNITINEELFLAKEKEIPQELNDVDSKTEDDALETSDSDDNGLEDSPAEDLEASDLETESEETVTEMNEDESEGESLESMSDEATENTNFEEGETEEFSESSYQEDESENAESDGEDFEEDQFSDGEDGFDEGSEEYAMEDSGDTTKVFSNFATYELEIFGEYAPYDKFTLNDGETSIGRDESQCQIVLNDPEVSSNHATIIKTKISAAIKDNNSGNGTLLNGARINEAELKNGDEFIIGSTTFTLRVGSDLLKQEKDRLLPVEENQVIEVQEVVEVESVEELESEGAPQEEEPKSIIKKLIWKYKQLPPKKQKIYAVVFIGLLFMMMEDSPDKKAPTKKPKSQKQAGKDGDKKKDDSPDSKLTLEEREFVAATYQLAFEFIQQGRYPDALAELDKVMKLSPDYKESKTLFQMANEGLRKLEELEQKRKEELERKRRQKKIDELLIKAKEYVKEKKVEPAEAIFSKILELDPENFDIPQLKLEIDAWKKEQERIAVEKAQKEADRKRRLSQIAPSRSFYSQEEWYKAILKLEEFLTIKDMDEDLIKEANDMLKTSRESLKGITSPLIGRARSLKEGQDLKGAYEQYLTVLDYDPVNEESLNEMNTIRDTLVARSKRVYREGLISESLQLFDVAKEKFQEVQQISPSDSDYYKKASKKLKDYLE